MNYGDLFWVSLPMRGGREQSGRRPAVIWQDVAAFTLPTVLMIPLSTRADALRFPATLEIQPTSGNGLTAPAIALVFQLGACDVRRFENRIGQLDAADLLRLQALAKQLQNLP
jgi:mRNA-degrading endonuclease toxin of MazEF toxin-antitoxin module